MDGARDRGRGRLRKRAPRDGSCHEPSASGSSPSAKTLGWIPMTQLSPPTGVSPLAPDHPHGGGAAAEPAVIGLPQMLEARLALLEAQTSEAARLIGELQARDRLKTQFLANISHDLRTPLTAIITHAEILRDGILGDLSEKQRT